MKFRLFIENKEYSGKIRLPIQTLEIEDESLDVVSFVLPYLDKEEPFEPFTLAKLQISDGVGEKEIQVYIASDSTEKILSSGKTTHTLVLIEETKEAERLLLTKTTSNPLIRDYTDTTAIVEPVCNNWLESAVNKVYSSPLKKGTEIVVKNYKDVVKQRITDIEYSESSAKIKVIAPNGETVLDGNYETKDTNITLDQVGTYTIIYSGRAKYFTKEYFSVYFYIGSLSQGTALDKSVSEVVENLLSTVETLRDGDRPKITFNIAQQRDYQKVVCPEMSFSKQTLWEALRQIGGVIHCLPRISNGQLYFDSLQKTQYSRIAEKKPISETSSHNIEQFCSHVQSTVDNLIALDGTTQGSVEDYGGYFKTVRTETGNFSITEDNAFIQTMLPIGKIIKLECGYLSDGTFVGDITPFAQYEKTEYEGLSSYKSTYPSSKAYALYYNLGGKNIYGINFKVPNAVDPVFSNYAIKNIILKKIGKDNAWWENNNIKLFDLQFKVTYQPYFSATIRETKPNLKDLKFKSVLAYNQNANSVNSIAYGEHLKGVVSRLGNVEKKKVYLFKQIAQIPKAGEKFDKDYIISAVMCEFYQDFIKCEITLSKNFNRWNNFVGVKNEIRMFEVSNKQIEERPVIWEDYAVVQPKTQGMVKSIVETDKVDIIDKNAKVMKGIPFGESFIVYNKTENYSYIGKYNKDYQFKHDWEKKFNNKPIQNIVVGEDKDNNILFLTINNAIISSQGTVYFYDKNYFGTDYPYSLGDEILFDTRITSLAYGDNMFIATGYGVGSVPIIQITPNAVDTQKVDVKNLVQTFDGDEIGGGAKITYVKRKDNTGVFVSIGKNFIYYRKDGMFDANGEPLFVSKPITFDSSFVKEFKVANIETPAKDNGVFAYSNNTIFIGEYALNTPYDEMSWSAYQLPVGDIVEVAYWRGVYVAINETKMFYSKDCVNWVEMPDTFEHLTGIVAGEDKLLLLNGTEYVQFVELKGNNSLITFKGLQEFSRYFATAGSKTSDDPVKIANAITYDKFKNELKNVWLPTIVGGRGNTLQIQFEYEDNFNAGNNAQTELENTSGFIKTQNYIPYGNEYGEAEYISIDMYSADPYLVPKNYQDYLSFGDNLPYINEISSISKPVLSTKSNLLLGNKNFIVLKKDGREKIRFDYFLHFVANDENLFIGSGLAQVNAFAMNITKNEVGQPILKDAKVYITNREIGSFEKVIDVSDMNVQEEQVVCEVDYDYGKIRFKPTNPTMVDSAQTWFLAVENPLKEGEHLLLFGKNNTPFKKGTSAEDVWGKYEIAFTHEVDEFL